MSRRASIALAASAAAVVLLADQLTKAWALRALPPREQVVAVPGWLWFRLLRNTGATFSLLRGYNLLFSLGSLLVLLAVAVILARGWLIHPLPLAALGAVAGGTLGNLLDRVRLRSVTDFIQVPVWPTDFNLADAAIRLGVVAFLLGLLLERRRRPAG